MKKHRSNYSDGKIKNEIDEYPDLVRCKLEEAIELTPSEISKLLRDNKWIPDSVIDSVFPTIFKDLSCLHWTPVQVIRRSLSLFELKENEKVLDIGAGIGKFCVIAGILYPKTQFYGVEQREHFVAAGKQATEAFFLDNVTLFCGNITEIDCSHYDAFYLYNPFYENLVPTLRMDASMDLSIRLYRKYVLAVKEVLSSAKIGTRVVTYFGFGGSFPASYEQICEEFPDNGPVQLWIKKW